MNRQKPIEPTSISSPSELISNVKYLEKPRTLLVEDDDQDKSVGDLTEFTQRVYGDENLHFVGLVDPTEETTGDLAALHAEHSIFRTLDVDPENIQERLKNGALLAVWSTTSLARIAGLQRAYRHRLSMEAVPKEVYVRNNLRQSGSGGRGSRIKGISIAKNDYEGSLSGGPLRVGGIVNRSPK